MGVLGHRDATMETVCHCRGAGCLCERRDCAVGGGLRGLGALSIYDYGDRGRTFTIYEVVTLSDPTCHPGDGSLACLVLCRHVRNCASVCAGSLQGGGERLLSALWRAGQFINRYF